MPALNRAGFVDPQFRTSDGHRGDDADVLSYHLLEGIPLEDYKIKFEL